MHHNNRGLALLFLHELDEAEREFRAALETCVEAAAETIIDEALLGLAAVDVARGRLGRAARLTGAAKRREARRNAAEDIVWSRLANDIVAPARMRHGQERWDLAEREGTTMAIPEAIDYALERGRFLLPSTSAGKR